MPRSGCLALHGVNPNLKKKKNGTKIYVDAALMTAMFMELGYLIWGWNLY